MRRAQSSSLAPRGRRAFTLVELLVVMGIIALLTTLLFSVIILARRHARDAACKSNLNQIWKATNVYANEFKEVLFVNYSTPLRISNVVYKDARASGFGCLYPKFLPDYRVLFCPGDPVRDPAWEFGWANWNTPTGEVQVSYGYRERQNLVANADTALKLAALDGNPQKVFACDFYEPHIIPPRIHHPRHINLLRCNGQVEQANRMVGFGPTDADIQAALNALDR